MFPKFLPQSPLSILGLPQQTLYRIITKHDGPSPWLLSLPVITTKRPTAAKEKACYCEATLAATTEQVNKMLDEYDD
jgi:hypothetical protein